MTKNRIQKLFQEKNESILSVFYTAGFPKLNDTVSIGVALEKAGADLIEVGIPFSDPVADGPTIQDSNKIALDNGINVKLILAQVRELRSKVKLPIILMGYLNPVLQYGMEAFVKDAGAAGVDGFIFPDMPWFDYEGEYKSLFDANNLSAIFLIAPTTSSERIQRIDAASNAFIYAVSASSTTGARQGFDDDQLAYFQRLKEKKLKNPFLIGFGISNRETFQTASSYGAGAIVGSAFVKMLKESKDITRDTETFVKELKTK
ncbi:MAG: tryptophan synthase subunit alpha [Bacteroidota bacterium]